MAYLPDPSVNTTSTSDAPPSANGTSATAPAAPPDPTAGATAPNPAPSMPVAPGSNVPPPPSKGSFGESFARTLNGPSYTVTPTGDTVSTAPARTNTKGSILGGALAGILRSAVEGMEAPTDPNGRGRGSAVSAGMRNASEMDKQRDAKAREQARMDFQQKQQATDAAVKNNFYAAQTHDLVIKSQHEEEEFPEHLKSLKIENEEHQTALQNALDQRRDVHAQLTNVLISHGIQPHATVSQTPGEDGKSIDAQAKPHIPAVVGGKSLPVQSGGIGKSNGASFFSTADLSQPITEPISVPYYTGEIGNDGKYVAHQTVLSPDGTTNFGDVARLYMAADNSLDQFMKRDAAKMAAEAKKADIGKTQAETKNQNAEANEHQAQANKTNADIKLQQDLNPTSASGLTGDQYLQTLPQGLRGTVQAIGEGRQTYSDRQLFDSKTGLPNATLQAVQRAYSDFDVSKAKTWQKTRDEYMGQGATAKKIVSYNTSMEHMRDLYDSTTKEGMFNPLSDDYQKRTAAMGFVSQEVGNAVKNGVMSESEGKEITKGISGGLTPGLNRERVQETAKLLHDKLDEYQTKFNAGAPSSAVKVPTLMSVKGADAYDYVRSGGKIQSQAPQANAQQTYKVGDPIIQNGQTFHVTSVDANGRPTGAQ